MKQKRFSIHKDLFKSAQELIELLEEDDAANEFMNRLRSIKTREDMAAEHSRYKKHYKKMAMQLDATRQKLEDYYKEYNKVVSAAWHEGVNKSKEIIRIATASADKIISDATHKANKLIKDAEDRLQMFRDAETKAIVNSVNLKEAAEKEAADIIRMAEEKAIVLEQDVRARLVVLEDEIRARLKNEQKSAWKLVDDHDAINNLSALAETEIPKTKATKLDKLDKVLHPISGRVLDWYDLEPYRPNNGELSSTYKDAAYFSWDRWDLETKLNWIRLNRTSKIYYGLGERYQWKQEK